MPRLTNSVVNDLGDRLRATTASPEDLALLSQYRDEHLPALAGVLATLRGLPFARRTGGGSVAITARQKNAQTIIEKLRRESRMQLVRMRDIAGARIVIPLDRLGRAEQDSIVAEIQTAFPGNKPFDRRIDPRSGYRAFHFEVGHHGRHAEIQVRTHFQDLWAQVFERLGDEWGRQSGTAFPPTRLTRRCESAASTFLGERCCGSFRISRT